MILGEFGGAESLEKRLVDAWLEADSDDSFDSALAQIGDEIERSRDAGKQQEELNSELAVEDGAMKLEREFTALSVPGRLRLGFGTRLMNPARGVEQKRHSIRDLGDAGARPCSRRCRHACGLRSTRQSNRRNGKGACHRAASAGRSIADDAGRDRSGCRGAAAGWIDRMAGMAPRTRRCGTSREYHDG